MRQNVSFIRHSFIAILLLTVYSVTISQIRIKEKISIHPKSPLTIATGGSCDFAVAYSGPSVYYHIISNGSTTYDLPAGGGDAAYNAGGLDDHP